MFWKLFTAFFRTMMIRIRWRHSLIDKVSVCCCSVNTFACWSCFRLPSIASGSLKPWMVISSVTHWGIGHTLITSFFEIVLPSSSPIPYARHTTIEPSALYLRLLILVIPFQQWLNAVCFWGSIPTSDAWHPTTPSEKKWEIK